MNRLTTHLIGALTANERQGEIFWVRTNNSTRALPEIEIEDYVRDRW